MGAPDARRNVARTCAADVDGLARRTYVSKSNAWPTRPSASAHFCAVLVTPKLLCASNHVADVPPQYMARSDTTGISDTTVVDTAVSASWGSSPSTYSVKRPLAGTTL